MVTIIRTYTKLLLIESALRETTENFITREIERKLFIFKRNYNRNELLAEHATIKRDFKTKLCRKKYLFVRKRKTSHFIF